MSTLRLILWPSVITLVVSIARITAEATGYITPQSGGALVWLGISWLPFVFGGWFGLRLAQSGGAPRLRPAWPWPPLAFVALAAAVMWRFGPLIGADQSDATFALLQDSVRILAAVAVTLAAAVAFVWPRLAWTLFCYAVPARVTVIALTWLAKHQGWDTHYTKFGPPGIECDLPTTMLSATLAQCGFWIPFTILAGSIFGTWFDRREPRR